MEEDISNKKVAYRRRILHFICFLMLILIDQLTKLWARNVLYSGAGISGKDINIIPKVLVLTFVKNTGAVFGLFKDQVLPISILCIIIFIILCCFYLRIPNSRKFYPLTFILIFITAGAIGNLIDRIAFGYVTDFIYFEIINFAVFNVADMYITVSVFIMIILTLFYYKEDELELLLPKKKKM